MPYQTVTGVFEWARYSEYCFDGCEHDCRYCYSRTKAIATGRKTAKNWSTMIINQKRFEKNFGHRSGTTMFPTQHDITPETLEPNLAYIHNILKPGNRLLIVSKPHLTCIREICERFSNYQDQILFRFTIGSLHDRTLKFWEPNAPAFEERFEALKFAYRNGFKTSVSAEPYLDQDIVELVVKLKPYLTDVIWIGKMNKISKRVDTTKWTPDDFEYLREINMCQASPKIWRLYDLLKGDSKVKWKDSIKEVVGIKRSTIPGEDR